MGFRVSKGFCVLFKMRGSDGKDTVTKGGIVGDFTRWPLIFG